MEQEIKQTEKAEYKSIFKATTLFGGVQVWNMLIGIIRSKLTAMLLGPFGMGVSGLYTSSVEMINSCTNFGLSSSGVKYIASAQGEGGILKSSRVVAVFHRLMFLTGMLGLLAVVVLSPYLSKSAFGNNDFILPFVFLSIMLLFQQMSAGYLAELQGSRQLKSLAKASLIGSLLSLVTTVPLYYFFGVSGIVPVLILASLSTLTLNWFFARKIKKEKVRVPFKDVLKEGKEMIVMGVAMTLTGILGTIVAYVIRIFISRNGGAEEVGLYTAGMTILNTYVGMVFTAMSTDYFPRLSLTSQDNKKSISIVNQQAEISLVILGMVLPLFIAVSPFFIVILYSNSFLPINDFLKWGSVGVIMKALSWAISFLFIAKGDLKLFVTNEVVAKVFSLCSSLIGYQIWGIEGLGIAYVVSYSVYLLWVYSVSRKKYGLRLSSSLIKVLLLTGIFTVSVFLVNYFSKESVLTYIISAVIVALSLIIMLKELNRRVALEDIKNRFLHKK